MLGAGMERGDSEAKLPQLESEIERDAPMMRTWFSEARERAQSSLDGQDNTGKQRGRVQGR